MIPCPRLINSSSTHHHLIISAKGAAAPAPKAAAVPAGKTTAPAKAEAAAPQVPAMDSPAELKPEDLTPFPCALPDEILVDIIVQR